MTIFAFLLISKIESYSFPHELMRIERTAQFAQLSGAYNNGGQGSGYGGGLGSNGGQEGGLDGSSGG